MSTGKRSFLTNRSHLVFLVLCILFWGGEIRHAEAREEYAVKAAFIYNFAKFSQWTESSPTAEDQAYDLCVVGEQFLQPAFQTITDKKINDQALHTHFKRTVDRFDSCDILFISRDVERVEMRRILTAVKGAPILTIGEIPDFTRMGGVINLVNTNEGEIRFKVNLDIARQQHIKISSRILRLAISVDGEIKSE